MDSLRKAPNETVTLSFKPLALALVEFNRVLREGGIEESNALTMTRKLLVLAALDGRVEHMKTLTESEFDAVVRELMGT